MKNNTKSGMKFDPQILLTGGARLLLLALWTSCASNSFADGMDLDVHIATQYQDLGEDSAQMTSLAVSPAYTLGDWDFALSLPYSYTEGSYFRNSVRPWVQNFCDRLLALDSWQQQVLIRRGRITAERLDECRQLDNAAEKYSLYSDGIGDATASVRYSLTLGQAQSWLAFFGLHYSHDNGDYEEGLGKGSRDTEISAGLLHSLGAATLTLISRYSFVHATGSLDDIQDYASIAISADYAVNDYIAVGGEYGFEQSYFVGLEDIETVTLFFNTQFTAHWSAQLFARQYANGDEFAPDSEYGLILAYSLE